MKIQNSTFYVLVCVFFYLYALTQSPTIYPHPAKCDNPMQGPRLIEHRMVYHPMIYKSWGLHIVPSKSNLYMANIDGYQLK